MCTCACGTDHELVVVEPGDRDEDDEEDAWLQCTCTACPRGDRDYWAVTTEGVGSGEWEVVNGRVRICRRSGLENFVSDEQEKQNNFLIQIISKKQ